MTIEFSKCISLLCCVVVCLFMVFTALCRALCLLLYRKLVIPSYAKPMKPDIIVAKILLFSFLFSGNLGKTMSISFSNIWCSISFNDSICCL